MRVILRLPFYAQETTVDSPTGPQQVRAYQIVVWVSVRIRGLCSKAFPAILDTGHSHNFSISEKHLYDWTGTRPEDLRQGGHITFGNRTVPLRLADVALVPNRPGTRDSAGEPCKLVAPAGIVVFEDDYPRLPLLGLRALVRSGLKTVIDGQRLQVSIGSGWRI